MHLLIHRLSQGMATALHIAVEKNHRQIASLLITFGADVNAKDKYDFTPLHLVNKKLIYKLLMKFGADPLVRSRLGQLPSEAYEKRCHDDGLEPDLDMLKQMQEAEEAAVKKTRSGL